MPEDKRGDNQNLKPIQPGLCDLCQLPLDSTTKRWCISCLATMSCHAIRCERCGLALYSATAHCGQCLQDPPPWHQLVCVNDYQYPVSWYIKQLKYRGQFLLANDLCDLLVARITMPPEAIIAVPMHWRRRIVRGYNHSELLAKSLSKSLKVPYLDRAITRNRHTAPQQGQSKQCRRRNLKGAFTLRYTPLFKHIAIVDDVVTTGSTVRNMCQLLLAVGVERIDIYCISRTPEPGGSGTQSR